MRRVRAMTFNLRRDVPEDGRNAWPHRCDAAAAVVRRHRPAVLGTQEGLPHQLRDLDARLPGYVRVGGCRRGDGQDEHNAVFFDASRFEAEAWGDRWLSASPDVPGSRSWGNELPRIVTWVRLRERGASTRFVVANTHLDHRSEASRLRSIRWLAEEFSGALVVGDFNAVPGDAVHRAAVGSGWQDSWLSAGRAEEGTFHGFSGRLCGRIDWILAPADARVVSCEVVRERPEGVFPSDHDPVVADVVMPRSVPVLVAPEPRLVGAE